MHSLSSRTWIGLFICGFPPACPALAQFVFTAQTRSVSAAMSGANSFHESAPDFEPFDASVSSNIAGGYCAHADQLSSLDPAAIMAAGDAVCVNPFWTYEEHTGDAASEVLVEFDLAEPARITLTGEIFADFDHGGFNDGDAYTFVELLADDGQPVYDAYVDWANPYLAIDFETILPPGSYSFHILSFAMIWTLGTPEDPGFGGGGSGDYDLELAARRLPVHNLAHETGRADLESDFDAPLEEEIAPDP